MWGAQRLRYFVLISQRARETRGSSADVHFLGVLAVAVVVVAITEFRDTIRGEQSEAFFR